MKRSFSAVLHRWFPDALNTSSSEWLRALCGAALAMLLVSWLSSMLYGREVALHLMGPFAASAVLLFAVSSGALSQPWSIIGSYLVASLSAVLVCQVASHSVAMAVVSLALTLFGMCLLRCLHPPAAAMAMTLGLAEDQLATMQWSVLWPVMLDATVLLACAWAYNNVTGVRYPRRLVVPANPHATRDLMPDERVGINHDDLEQALRDFGGFVDITADDLKRIVQASEHHALRRGLGELRAAQVMSRDLCSASLETPLQQAWKLLKRHHLKALPVVDAGQRVVGIVTLLDLAVHFRRDGILGRFHPRRKRRLGQIMSTPATCVQQDTHLADLIPLLSGRGHHCLPVLEGERLVGMLSQTDLIAGMGRVLLGGRVSSEAGQGEA